MQIEDFIKQSIADNDPIETIYNSLCSYFEVDISPVVCSSLFIPIIQHAIRNRRSEKAITIYSNALARIYAYTSNEDIDNKQIIFEQSAKLIKVISQALRNSFIIEDHELDVKTIEPPVLMNVLAIVTEACSTILSENEDFYFNTELSIIWDTLPQLVKLCGYEFKQTSCIILKSTVNICKISMERDLVDYDDLTIYYLLVNILRSMNKPNIPLELQHTLANTIAFIIEFCPYLQFNNTSVLAQYTNSYTLIAQTKSDPILLKSALHLSCLLAKHKVKIQLISEDMMRKFQEADNMDAWIIDLLNEKHVSIVNNEKDNDISAMDIDEEMVSTLARMNSTITVDSMHDKVIDVVRELTELTENNDRGQQLLIQLKYISVLMNNADLLVLCRPYMKQIAEFVTRILVVDPGFAENVTQLFGFQIPQFMSAFLEYTLPYAVIYTDNDDSLLGIATSLEVTIKSICQSGASRIIVRLLMENDDLQLHGQKRLQQIFQNKNIVKELANDNSTKITTKLAMLLGAPDQKQSALNGLVQLKEWTRPKKEQLSDYISSYFIAILERVSRFISEKRDQKVYVQDPYALVALGEIMTLLKSNIKDHTIHLMKVFETVNKLPGMQLKVLSLWKIFVSLLETDVLRSLLSPITQSLIDILTISNHETRKSVAKALEDLLIDKPYISPEDYANLPYLPDYQELSHLNSYIDSHRMMKSASEQLKTDIQQILQNFEDFDNIKVLLGLQKLERILLDGVDLVEYRDQLYSKLIYLITKYSSHQQIPYLAAVSLGKLGAVDPGLVKMTSVDDTVFIMNDFHRQDEKLAFICDLIINHIYPSYNAVSEVNARLCIEYSIQTLLQQAGYQSVEQMKSKDTLLAVYTSWRKLPKSIQEFLTPFLQSAYQISITEQLLEYPIYPKAKSFQDWVKHWFCRMTECACNPAKQIFNACVPMVQSDLMDITLHLVPYLVLHIILSGTPDHVRGIVDELMLVFNTNAKPNDQFSDDKMNHYALQVAVSITEYCRKWLNHVGTKDNEKKSQINRVNTFLQLIPSITMGIAAFHTKAYPQALMQLETHIKESRSKSMDPEILKYLRQIFIQLDDPLSLKVLMDTFASVLSLEEEIFRYESIGKWSEAEVLYRKKIQDNPFELSPYEGYMECLKKSGNYESLLYIADKEFASIPNLMPRINSFKIDSAWHLKDWSTLDQAVNSPIQKNFQAMVGCTLDHMLRQRHIEASCTIEEARFSIIEQIKMNSHTSYRRYYPLLFNLQLLQELENAQLTWESSDPVANLSRLEAVWKNNRKLIKPRSLDQIRILELRKAAFFDVRDTEHLQINESELWLRIAKENRKMGNMAVSLNALNQAERTGGKSFYLEKAKWFWKNGYTIDAARLIKSKNQDIDNTDPYDALFLTDIFINDSDSYVNTHKYHMRSLKVGPEKIEKAYHNFGSFFLKYFPPDRRAKLKKIKVQNEILKFSSNALKYGSKYYYSSMSRLINTWLDIANANVAEELQREDEEATKLRNYISNANTLMERIPRSIPLYQFSLFLTRLISHLSTDDERIANCLTEIIGQVFMAYPRNTIWLMMGSLESHSPNVSRRMNKILDIAKAKSNTKIPVIIQQAIYLKRGLYDLSKYEDKNHPNIDISTYPRYKNLLNLKDLDLYMPKEANMLPTLPEVIVPSDRQVNPFPEDSPTIKCLGDRVQVMKSLQAPKKISFYGSDGRYYPFLLKRKDDLRKDARTMEFNYMINHFLKKNPDSRDCELYIRTYFVIPMGDRWGLIEWIDNLNPLKSIVNGYWEAAGNPTINQIGGRFTKAALSLPSEKLKYFVSQILPYCPSVFYKWFLKNFPESNQWLNSRTRYIKTLAVMSIVGYLIGLGDRHAENILFDETNGDCIHVDLNMLFGSGMALPVPEIVPFRLTHNLVGAMGIFGTKGLFQKMCEVTLEVLRANKEPLISVFQTYVNELEASERLTLKSRSTQITSNEIINTIDEKFEMGTEVSVKVQKLIHDATSNEKLSQMFVGWCPFV